MVQMVGKLKSHSIRNCHIFISCRHEDIESERVTGCHWMLWVVVGTDGGWLGDIGTSNSQL